MQDLMWRQWNIKTSASPFGMLGVKTRYSPVFVCVKKSCHVQSLST
jgi:hypothetical protein